MKIKKIHVFRVKPKEELLTSIKNYCEKRKITSAIVFGIIGSLENVELGFLKKLPGKYITKKFSGPLEIVHAQGSVALKNSERIIHIHIQISDEKKSIGGHLLSGKIFSTAEVILCELDYQLKRYKDNYTGLYELIIK